MDDFITFTKNGLEIKQKSEIKDILKEEYKRIYGVDIDLSNGSQNDNFLNLLSDLIYQPSVMIQLLYNNLDVNFASGVFLEALCERDNLRRKSEEYSKIICTVKNSSNKHCATGLVINNKLGKTQRIILTDDDGLEWTWIEGANWDGTFNTYFYNDNESGEKLTFICEKSGPVKRPLNPRIIDLNSGLKVIFSDTNAEDFILGKSIETDTELRERHNEESGFNGTTTKESIESSLLELEEVIDCYVTKTDTKTLKIIVRLANSTEETRIKVYHTVFNKINPLIKIESGNTGEEKNLKLYNPMMNKPINVEFAKKRSGTYTITLIKYNSVLTKTEQLEVLNVLNKTLSVVKLKTRLNVKEIITKANQKIVGELRYRNVFIKDLVFNGITTEGGIYELTIDTDSLEDENIDPATRIAKADITA